MNIPQMRFQQLLRLFIIALIGLGAAAVAEAQEATPQQRAEVNKLIRERDQLHQKLETLDRQATEAIKQGQDPLDLHAAQVNVQDELDLVQLRLEILATRYGLPIPAVPGEEDVRHTPADTEEMDRAVRETLARGRNRAMAQLHEEHRLFLASLDFSSFLAFN